MTRRKPQAKVTASQGCYRTIRFTPGGYYHAIVDDNGKLQSLLTGVKRNVATPAMFAKLAKRAQEAIDAHK